MVYIFLGVIILILSTICIIFYRKYDHIKFLYDRTNDITNTMMRVSEELRDFKNLDDLYMQLLNDTLKLITGAENGTILIYNEKTDLLEYKAAVGYDMESLRKVEFRKEELFLFITKKLMAPDIIRNPRSFDKKYIDPGNYNNLQNNKALEMKVCLSAPLYVNGKFHGVINIDNPYNENAFDKNDIRFIQYICRQLEVAITNAKLMNKLIEALRIDKLTGIYNRRYFDDIIEREIIRAEGSIESQYLVMIDMDNFKGINDNYGHRIGDEILTYFANVLRKGIEPRDIVARYAGDEFIMVIHGGSMDEVEERIYKVREYLDNNKLNGISIEFSAGICKFEKGMSYDRILTNADDNMYAQKRERNSCRCK
ncbi:MAG: sensor diguanylate cyclase [Clostridiales bacterium]|jgi:diguanylate cyclase (GGDEF)-like protein|nr:sensor diguanylate cyclase [Clostridiales bacterium]